VSPITVCRPVNHAKGPKARVVISIRPGIEQVIPLLTLTGQATLHRRRTYDVTIVGYSNGSVALTGP
jgi:hypothetical protein